MHDLNELAVFAAVVRAGGFTAAARALGMQKSTVSRRVARLEERLGAQLLVRTSRQVAVTEAGRAFFERCDEGLRLLAAAEGEVALVDRPAGSVRITAVPDFAQVCLAPLVGRFVALHPLVNVELVLTTRVVDLVEEGVDLAIRSGPLPDSSLVARKIATVRRRLVASPAYLAARGFPADLGALSGHECLAYRTTDGVATWRVATPSGPRNARVGARLAADDFQVLKGWALAGQGIAVLPGFVCQPEIDDGRLVPVLVDALRDVVPLYLVHPASRHLPARVRALKEFLVEALDPDAPPAQRATNGP